MQPSASRRAERKAADADAQNLALPALASILLA
jgi:hypothetical protein